MTGGSRVPLRSLVAASSVALGTLALVAVTTVLAGIEHVATEGFRQLAAGTILVSPSDQSLVSGKLPLPLTADDARAIERLPEVASAHPVVALTGMLRACGTRHVVRIVGVDASAIAGEQVVAGRSLARADVDASRQVVVLTTDIADRIPCASRRGERLWVSGRPFDLVGEVEGFSLDGVATSTLTAFLPVTTAMRLYGAGERRLAMLRVDAAGDVATAADAVRFLLRRRHGVRPGQFDDFEVTTRSALLSAAGEIGAAIQVGVISLIAISIFAATIGVLNTMLTSVTERKPEIGLRRSVGATRRQIVRQFLLEAIAITGGGGAIGIALGLVAAWPFSALLEVPYTIDWSSVGLAVAACVSSGLLAGTMPALLAARLDPVVALHHE